jgi:putative PIN family toxin of toxin-antitoxin system
VVRATADSNIYVSAFNFGGPPRRLLWLAEEGKIRLAISDVILDETMEVMRRPKFNQPASALNEARAYLTRITERVVPTQTLDVVKDDPDDNAVIECALAACSDFIVSGDKHLLKVGAYGSIQIVKVSEFLTRIMPIT